MDFCEGGKVLVYVWFIWEDCKCEYRAFAGKAPLMLPNKDKAPVLPSSLPNESALLTYSEDDSDTDEMFRDAETIPDKVLAPIPPSPLSPCRTRVSGPNSSCI